jgi:hypothetical protein
MESQNPETTQAKDKTKHGRPFSRLLFQEDIWRRHFSLIFPGLFLIPVLNIDTTSPAPSHQFSPALNKEMAHVHLT